MGERERKRKMWEREVDMRKIEGREEKGGRFQVSMPLISVEILKEENERKMERGRHEEGGEREGERGGRREKKRILKKVDGEEREYLWEVKAEEREGIYKTRFE